MRGLTRLKMPVVLMGLSLSALTLQAAPYPERPIRLVVSSAPGGAADLIARPIAMQMEKQFGYTIVVDNRAGANGIIGTDIVAKAVPDGYTFLVNTVAVTINPSVYRKLPYDTERDLLPVTNLALGSGYILIVHPSVPANSVQELIALARHKDSRFGYGTPGFGNGQHLAGELFNLRAGVPGFKFVGNWDGWFAPAHTPLAIIAHIYSAIRQTLQVPKIRDAIVAAGYDPVADTPVEFGQFVRAEIRKYAEIAHAAKIQPE